MADLIRDPSIEGVGGLSGLQGVNKAPSNPFDLDSDFSGNFKLSSKEAQSAQQLGRGLQGPISYVGSSEFGTSLYDADISTLSELYDLNESRANIQPWYDLLANGFTRMVGTAFTTFGDGVVGSVAGILNAAINADQIAESDSPWRELGNQFILNPISLVFVDIQDEINEALPAYKTLAQMEEPWWDHFFDSATIFGDFLPNLGFTIGAAYSGKVAAGTLSKAMGLKDVRNAFKGVVTTASGKTLNTTSEILKAYKTGDAFIDGVKLTKDLALAAKNLKQAEWKLKTVGAVYAAMGEGRIEAIHNATEWFDYNKELLDSTHENAINSIESNLFQVNPDWFGLVPILGEDGSLSYQTLLVDSEGLLAWESQREGLELRYTDAILKLSEDRVNFANNVFALNVGLLSASNLWQYGRFLSGGYSSGRQAKNLVKGSIKEGYRATNVGRQGIVRGLSNIPAEAAEEMNQGLISEAVGLRYVSELNEFYGAKINPEADEETITWLNAFMEGFGGTYGDVDQWLEGAFGALTALLGIPSVNFRTNSQGRRRPSISFEGELWLSISEGRANQREANTIAAALNNYVLSPEIVNYYLGLVRHNKFLNDMDNFLKGSDEFNYKNAELAQIVSDAITFDKAGRIQDLYDIIEEGANVSLEDVELIKGDAIDKETGVSLFEGKTDQLIIDHVLKLASHLKEVVDSYVNISTNLKTLYGENISQDLLELMTYMTTLIGSLEGRFKELFELIKWSANRIIHDYHNNKQVIIGEDLGLLIYLSATSPAELLESLNRDEIIDILTSLKVLLEPDRNKSIENQRLYTLLSDILKVYKLRNDFIDQYLSLADNPELFTEDAINQVKEALRVHTDKILDAALAELNTVENVGDLKQVLDKLLPSMVPNIILRVKEGNNDALKDVITLYEELASAELTVRDIISSTELSAEQAFAAGALLEIMDEAATLLDALDQANRIVVDEEVDKGVRDALQDLLNLVNRVEESLKINEADLKQPRKRKKGLSLLDSLSDSLSEADEEILESTTPELSNKELSVPRPDNVPAPPPVEKIRNDIAALTKEEVNETTLPDELIIEAAKLTTPELEERVKKGDEVAKAVYNALNPPASEDSAGTNSESTPSYKYDQSKSLRSWALSKYDFGPLSDRNRREAVVRDHPIVQALNELGAYDFVDEGYLGDIINAYPETPIYYVLSSDERLLDTPILAINITNEVRNVLGGVPSTAFQDSEGNWYQAVGSLGYVNGDQSSENNYRLIRALLIEELGEDTPPPYFVSDKFTNKIKRIYSGRFVKSTPNIPVGVRPLKTVLNGLTPHFGIYYSDSHFLTPGLDDYNLVVPINSNNANPRAGSIWLMTKEADGRYYGKAVLVKRFSEVDTSFVDTPLGKALHSSINTLVDSTKSNYDRSIAKYDIESILHFSENGPRILFNGENVSIGYELNGIFVSYFSSSLKKAGGSLSELALQLYEALLNDLLALRFQITPSELLDERYVNSIINSDILVTDLAIPNNVNASFDMYLNNLNTGDPIIDSEVALRGHIGLTGINPNIASLTVHHNGLAYQVFPDRIEKNGKPVLSQLLIDELLFIQSIDNGLVNPYSGSSTLYIGHYNTGEEFGVVNGKVKRGLELSALKDQAAARLRKRERSAKLTEVAERAEELTPLVEEPDGPTIATDLAIPERSIFDLLPSSAEEAAAQVLQDEIESEVVSRQTPTVDDNFNPSTLGKSAKLLQMSENLLTFDNLIRQNRQTLREFGIKNTAEFTSLAEANGIDVNNVKTLAAFDAMVDILRNCR